MITARSTTDDGRQLFVLGVTADNIRRLLNGQPIQVRAETHPGFRDDLVVLIVYGATDRDLVAALESGIGEDTKIIATPKDPSGQRH